MILSLEKRDPTGTSRDRNVRLNAVRRKVSRENLKARV